MCYKVSNSYPSVLARTPYIKSSPLRFVVSSTGLRFVSFGVFLKVELQHPNAALGGGSWTSVRIVEVVEVATPMMRGVAAQDQ
jgi:hypothetical protein